MVIETALICLALNVYHEARSEPIDGQLAVAAVTLNRVQDDRYPDTVCEVVYQNKQFSWTMNPPPIKNPEAFTTALIVATEASPNPDFGTHYHTTKVQPYWSASLTFLGLVGNHRFYQ